jgi:phosphoribosyl 1,2-cyclic phosphodiesterase
MSTTDSPRPPFRVKYWGTRGSIPAPGGDTVRYGGNTTCLELTAGDRTYGIDGGTGVRLFGNALLQRMPVDATFFMTHLHLDHVQGFPFFAPFLVPGNHFVIYSALHNGSPVEDVLKALFAQPAFPISMDDLRATLEFRRLTMGDTLRFGDLQVKTAKLFHPCDVCGYRFELDGRSFVHASDWEHPADGSLDQDFLDLARGCDVLSVDATYTEDEYHGRVGPPRQGWGHATHAAAVRHGMAAGAKRILLFHHEPARPDDQLDRIASTLLAPHPHVRFVREGDVIEL